MREIRKHGVTRHIICIRHGQYDETHKVCTESCANGTCAVMIGWTFAILCFIFVKSHPSMFLIDVALCIRDSENVTGRRQTYSDGIGSSTSCLDWTTIGHLAGCRFPHSIGPCLRHDKGQGNGSNHYYVFARRSNGRPRSDAQRRTVREFTFRKWWASSYHDASSINLLFARFCQHFLLLTKRSTLIPCLYSPCHHIPGGRASAKTVQTTDDNHPRIEAAFQKYFHRADYDDNQKYSEEHHEVEIIVCHANVIRYFLCRALQLPPEAWLRYCPFNCSLTYFTIRPTGTVSCRMVGDIGHLPYEASTFSSHEGFLW